MKTAVSIPDDLFEAAEQIRDQLGISRSELYARALRAVVERRHDDAVTAKLNELADASGPAPDPGLDRLQSWAIWRDGELDREWDELAPAPEEAER